MKTNIELIALLGSKEIPVREFLNLQKEDIIHLEHETQKPISLMINGVEKFKGFQGSYKGHKAISISNYTYVPPSLDEILGA